MRTASGPRCSITVDPWREDGRIRGVVVNLAPNGWVRERLAVQEQAAAAQRRYEQARDVIDALQRELLPTGVPVLPGLEVAATYLLADEENTAGDDWFDAHALDDGRIALVVGDVVGHGLAASATMGQLRVLLRERLLTTESLHRGRAERQPEQADPLLILDQPWAPKPRIRIDGPIDASTVGEVERALREAGATGTRELTVDLTGVSHLASAGVAAMHRITARHRANGTTLCLYAPTPPAPRTRS